MRIPAINVDGVSVKGCKYIYAPKGQAGEYAVLSTNPYRGCGHKCAYCYVPSVIRMNRNEFNLGAKDRNGYESGLLRDAKKYKDARIREQVMLSLTTDPNNSATPAFTRITLKLLKRHD